MKTNQTQKFREIELQQGEASERYLEETLQRARIEKKLPPWLLSWEHSKKWSAPDMSGIDFIIKTDKGDIKINVKSSRTFAKQFESRHRYEDIIPVVINILEPPNQFLGRFISLIAGIRKSM